MTREKPLGAGRGDDHRTKEVGKMYGAILGDIVGSPFEFAEEKQGKDEFYLFTWGCRFTDDTVMTIAVAGVMCEQYRRLRGLVPGAPLSDDKIRTDLIRAMKRFGRQYPGAGYGGRFYRWLFSEDTKPYNSFGNGSAMRVSSIGWLFDNLETTRHYARLSAEVTHDHPEGIKGAEAVASAIFLGRTGHSKEEIKEYVTREFGYDLSRTCDDIRPGYSFDVTCQGSVPEAIIAFLDGEGVVDAIRYAVSLGGDTDTQGAIAGSIAESCYPLTMDLIAECEARIPDPLRRVLREFNEIRLEQVRRGELKRPDRCGLNALAEHPGTKLF